jgi:hypothetical protein
MAGTAAVATDTAVAVATDMAVAAATDTAVAAHMRAAELMPAAQYAVMPVERADTAARFAGTTAAAV